MRIRRATKKLQDATPAPRHLATAEDRARMLEDRRRQLRLEDQARLDTIGLPRYVHIVDSE